jgi:hypothetical protein
MKILKEKAYIKSWEKVVIIGDKERNKTQKDPLIRVTVVE